MVLNRQSIPRQGETKENCHQCSPSQRGSLSSVSHCPQRLLLTEDHCFRRSSEEKTRHGSWRRNYLWFGQTEDSISAAALIICRDGFREDPLWKHSCPSLVWEAYISEVLGEEEPLQCFRLTQFQPASERWPFLSAPAAGAPWITSTSALQRGPASMGGHVLHLQVIYLCGRGNK